MLETKTNMVFPADSEHDSSTPASSESKLEKRFSLKDEDSPVVSTQINTESVNYLGYYSSHEEVMQQLILECAHATRRQIRNMVKEGMLFGVGVFLLFRCE